MSNPAPQLVQKRWNYPPSLCYGGTGCNMGLIAPARSGLRPSASQNPFRVLTARSSFCVDGLSFCLHKT